VIAFDPVTKADVRRVNLQVMLPGGDLFFEGLSEVELGKPVKAGWSDTYAVIGGTGKYFGGTGTAKLTLLPGDKVFSWVIKLVRPAGNLQLTIPRWASGTWRAAGTWWSTSPT